jgi:indole-3-glycerol phosphate synthase
MVPEGTLLAALSGISSRADVERFARAGASAVLVGEALMLADDPAPKVGELLGHVRTLPDGRAGIGRART